MTGIDRFTGEVISEIEDVRQSCADIIFTPLGSRIARRDYGSRFVSLIDQPANAANRALMYAAIATALRRWEPRLTVRRVSLTAVDGRDGAFRVDLESTVTDTGAAQSLSLSIEQGSTA